jgi:hypothetical protein
MALWLVRALMMTAGSWAAAKGYATQADVEAVAGGVAAAGGAAWSAYERYKAIPK